LRALGAWWAAAWLELLFWFTAHAPGVLWILRPLMVRCAWLTSRKIRTATRVNAFRLLGPAASGRVCRRYAFGVIGRFFDAVAEFGSNHTRTSMQVLTRLSSETGVDGYLQARKRGKGAVLVTAHFGSFETAIAMLRTREPRVHVVFKRDEFSRFEQLRARQRARLGVIEAPVDEGLATWARLRDALQSDEVVLFQTDRVLPGQKGIDVPFLGGHIRVPIGPIKLARMTGSPVIPVFASAEGKGKIQIEICEALWPEQFPEPSLSSGQMDPILVQTVQHIECVVLAHPDQWLCLYPVFVEDATK